MLAILHAVFDERAPAPVRELYHLACGRTAGICPKSAELLEDAEADALAYLGFPYAHHRRLRANNVQDGQSRAREGEPRGAGLPLKQIADPHDGRGILRDG